MTTDYFRKCIIVNSFMIHHSNLHQINANDFKGNPSQFWLALGTENLLDGNTHKENSIISSEINCDGYDRYQINVNHGSGSNTKTETYFKYDANAVYNRASFIFGMCPSESNPWSDIRCWLLFDDHTDGNLLAYGSLIDDPNASPVVVDPGTYVVIPAGAIEFRLEDMF